MSTTATVSKESSYLKVICDDRCAMVQRLSAVVKRWDKAKKFEFIERSAETFSNRDSFRLLDASKWSLVLIDDLNNKWEGPEAIPFILKNLPLGRLADQAFAILGKGDDAGRRARALAVLDDPDVLGLHDRDTGVRRPEIDADNLAHEALLVSSRTRPEAPDAAQWISRDVLRAVVTDKPHGPVRMRGTRAGPTTDPE